MIEFSVPDMTCGHCASTITRALKDADAKASVEISLKDHSVKVQPRLPADEVSQAIVEAGYTPQQLAG